VNQRPRWGAATATGFREGSEKEPRINGEKLAIRVDMPFCGSTVNRVTALVHRRI